MKDPKELWHYEYEKPSDFVRRLESCIPSGWLNASHMKYINLRIDMRTGAFVVYDQDGNPLTVNETERVVTSMEQYARNR